MGTTMIHRRKFVSVLALAAAAVGLNWPFKKEHLRVNWFHVAGVRYNPVQRPPKMNERVLLRRNYWHGSLCYEVRTEADERIGYVPLRCLVNIEPAEGQEWYISAVNRRGVPWKHYKVARCVQTNASPNTAT